MDGRDQDDAQMDWSKFEEYFQRIFPVTLPNQNDASWMKDLIGTTMGQRLSNVPTPFAASEPEVFETHRYVVVRARVTDAERLDHIRIRLSEHILLLEGLKQEPIRLPLPTAVKPRTAKAVYRDETLQITASKRNANTFYQDVPIRY